MSSAIVSLSRRRDAPDGRDLLVHDVDQLDLDTLPVPRPVLDALVAQSALPPPRGLPLPPIRKLDPLAVQALEQRHGVLVAEREARDRRDVEPLAVAREALRRIRQRRVVRRLARCERVARVQREVLHAAALDAARCAGWSSRVRRVAVLERDRAVLDRVCVDDDGCGTGLGRSFDLEAAEEATVLDDDDRAADVDACGTRTPRSGGGRAKSNKSESGGYAPLALRSSKSSMVPLLA